MIKNNRKKGILIFQDGSVLHGIGFGAIKKVIGEITFTTIPGSGYVEILTDFTHKNQLLVFSYPSIGNYGVPSKKKDENGILKHFESDAIQVKGIVVNEYCKNPSHYESSKTLEEWLIEEDIPGIQWIDTRMLIQRLVIKESEMALLKVYDSTEKLNLVELKKEIRETEPIEMKNIVSNVSTNNIKKNSPRDPKGTVVIYDLGVKNNIIRTLISRNLEVIIVPYTFNYEKIMALKPDGVLISNGPGNPLVLKESIDLVRNLIKASVPTLGIGLGNMIIGLAAGAKSYKLFAEHRGGRTIAENETGKCFITFHNHGYSLNNISIGQFTELYHDKDDKTNEGLIHSSKPIFSVAFNPEGAPGSFDLKNIIFNKFEQFMEV
ncbi:MAG: glutamine-hydrolyzing carbamoyl-phosphate synthase small subunit [Promethearchaeota archaeon]